jgi:uroporphyrin-III C-methyltransferase/precorrin-2 dehydrogenase/sirohydrochlorin ferrochelatase
MKYYPLFLDLRGQRCLVIGEGALAEEKVSGLRRSGAEVEQASTFQPGSLAGVRLVIDASGDQHTGGLVWEEAERLGVLVNVVDVPDRCRFIAPAVVDRDPLVVAISTSGESPFLASALRARLERVLGAEWGPFVKLVGRIRRQLRGQGVALAEQTPIYRRLLRSGVRRLFAEGRELDATFEASAITEAGAARPGRVALVGAGPGDPGLLTVAAQELLFEADLVIHDALVSPGVLALCGPQTRVVPAGKRGGRPSARQEDISAALIGAAREGLDVVRLKGGDPFVFGRGGEEMAALVEAGIEVLVLPGVSSVQAAPSAAGIPLTLRGMASSFAVTSLKAGDASGAGTRLEALAAAADTLVLLMPLADLDEVGVRLGRVLGDRPAALVAGASTPDQRVVRTSITGLADAARRARIEGPATLVVGEVVAWSASQQLTAQAAQAAQASGARAG